MLHTCRQAPPLAASPLLQSPSSRWYAVRRDGIAGSFAVPHPKRTETLRYPVKAYSAAQEASFDPLENTEKLVGPGAAHVGGGGGQGGGHMPPSGSSKLGIPTLLLVGGVMFAPELANMVVWRATTPEHEEQTVQNWSGTKEVECARYVEPSTLEALQLAVSWANLYKKRLRPVGAALSPNGAAFNSEGMVSLAQLDKVLSIDEDAMTVTVQAGIRVRELVEALRPCGLTLKNYASIREQQIGGFTQVGAHGTGAAVPPLDETVVALKLVTPDKGVLELSETNDPETFYMARCGVGALGVAAEVTLQCIKAHRLLEHTWTVSRAQIEANHEAWLRDYQHIRYMWVPHTDTVVVVGSNPLPEGAPEPKHKSKFTEAQKVEPMVRLLKEVAPGVDPEGMGFGELRDELLKVAPLDLEHVKRCNAAEAAFWKRNTGTRCDWSDQILGFDCGGQQHVYEIAFRTGDSPEKNTRADLQYMRELLDMIEREGIPAPAPIEQRWSAGSKSPMSPVSNDGDKSSPGLHSWIGIIMYLPTQVQEERDRITEAFKAYAAREEALLGDKYGIRVHWAKIELPDGENERRIAREKIAKRYPALETFRAIRKKLDPHGVLGNDLIEGLMGDPSKVRKKTEETDVMKGLFRYFGGTPPPPQTGAMLGTGNTASTSEPVSSDSTPESIPSGEAKEIDAAPVFEATDSMSPPLAEDSEKLSLRKTPLRYLKRMLTSVGRLFSRRGGAGGEDGPIAPPAPA